MFSPEDNLEDNEPTLFCELQGAYCDCEECEPGVCYRKLGFVKADDWEGL